MENAPVSYRIEGNVAQIAMDDGKSNALSPTMLRALGQALDRAERDHAVVVLGGRSSAFSAGFDLHVLKRGGPEALGMIRRGFELSLRLLSFPTPVVIACSGHALAMGAFVLLSGDYRVGLAGPFRIAANEVAIGLTMPRTGLEICRQRLAPAHFIRATALAETYGPEEAIPAGYLDRVAAPMDFEATVTSVATGLAALDLKAHANTKLRARKSVLSAMRAALRMDMADFIAQGARQFLGANWPSARLGPAARDAR